MDAPCSGAARLVVHDLQNGEHARRNAERREFVVHRPDFLRRGNLFDQGRFLHGLNVPVPPLVRQNNLLQGQADIEHTLSRAQSGCYPICSKVRRM